MKSISLILLLLLLTDRTRSLAYFQTNPTTANIYTDHYSPDRLYPGMSEWEIETTVRGDAISAVTVEGPNISLTSLEYSESDSGEWKWVKHNALPGAPSIGDLYTFHVTYENSTTEDLTASVTGLIEEFPTIISPVDNSTVTTTVPVFEWSPISTSLRQLSVSVISLPDGKFVWYVDLPTNATSVSYNSDGEGDPLESGITYIWMLWLSEGGDQDSHAIMFSEFTVGAEATTPTISGNISYSGASTDSVRVFLVTDPTFNDDEMDSVSLDSPGNYAFTGLADGTYYVVSAMPSVDEEGLQLADPWGIYGTFENPTPITITDGNSVSGIDITLVDGTVDDPNPFYEKYPVELWSSNWHYGADFLIGAKVEDPDHQAISAEVSGPGINGSYSLVYLANEQVWTATAVPVVNFHSSPPAPPLTYTFTIVDSVETTVVTDIVESFLSEYPTNLSPSGGEPVTGSPVFSWTWAYTGYTYWVKLHDAAGIQIWDAYDLTERTTTYDGPILTVGSVYFYEVAVADQYSNLAHSEESFVFQTAVGVDEKTLPLAFNLLQNYPNPFNLYTNIDFSLSTEGSVDLVVYNLTGQLVRRLVSRRMLRGNHSVIWDGRDDGGIPVSSGIYFSRILGSNSSVGRRMLLVR